MKRTVLLLALFVLTLLVVGCSTTAPVAVTSNAVGSKIGQASTTMILGFFPMAETRASTKQPRTAASARSQP